MMNRKINKQQKNSLVRSIFTNKKILLTISVTIAILLFFRLGSDITMPFLRVNQEVLSNQSNNFFDLLNLLGGGGLSQVSLFAIGISPYITAQIIIQLLSTELIPPLANLAKSGERGKRKIESITRILTLPFAIVQAYAILALLASQHSTGENMSLISMAPGAPASLTIGSPLYYFFYIVLMLAGTYIAVFLGDVITKRGVGNGMSLIIMTGVVSSLFYNFSSVFRSIQGISFGSSQALSSIITFVVYLVFYLLVLLAVVFINGSVRKIPIQQVGQALIKDEKDLSYLPFKINTSGVIPVIFASSVMLIPSVIAQFLPQNDPSQIWINNNLSLQSWPGLVLYFILVLIFTFFYSYVQINPDKIASDFKKSGRFIPGVKAGKDTEKYLSKVLFRINCIGGPFLGLIACLPYMVSLIIYQATSVSIGTNSSLGGTGIVILVSVSIEFVQALKSIITTSGYSSQRKQIEKFIETQDYISEEVSNNISQLW